MVHPLLYDGAKSDYLLAKSVATFMAQLYFNFIARAAFVVLHFSTAIVSLSVQNVHALLPTEYLLNSGMVFAL